MYSMGLTMHELLTGKVPFEGVRLEQVLKRRLNDDVPSVRALAPSVSIGFARVIASMTQRERDRRPATWRALAAELAASEGRDSGRFPRAASTGAMRSASGERPGSAKGRAVSERNVAATAPAPRRLPVAALVVLALALGAAAGGLLALLAR
jgi:hypothetical protein